MKSRYVAVGLLCMHGIGYCGKYPSPAVVNTCLSERQLSEEVEWVELPTREVILRERYKRGYDAVYFYDGKTAFGVAQKDPKQAIIYNGALHPVSRARKIPGFETSNAEVDALLAGWGTIKEKSGTYLCINFPSGALGQSGSFQYVRNVLLLQISPGKSAGVLYSAIGRVTPADD